MPGVVNPPADPATPSQPPPPALPLLGATWIPGQGTRLGVWSRHASSIEVCLPDHPNAGPQSPVRVPLHRLDDRLTSTPSDPDLWVATIEQLHPGQRYGLRADGPWQPEHGHVFNADKLLVDPYAYALSGLDTYDPHATQGSVAVDPWRRDNTDSAGQAPWSVVVDHRFDWGEDRAPRTPMHRSVIYEAHVRGLTMTHPQVPEPLRGTYAGLAHPAIIEHLLGLGVTAIELLPIHAYLSEAGLLKRGLTNYWGYNTLGFFAPHPSYAAASDPQAQVREVKQMIKDVHAAGIEVILDVVYNHTCEAGLGGPTVSLRGLDNAEYYRRNPGHPLHYADVTGCGNSVDYSKPHACALVMDSLRYWVNHYHVDGFRFDLATTLGRGSGGYFDPHSALFTAMRQDPALAPIKLIAEPWDVGDGGYQVGYFPAGMAEWNDAFRNDVRDFWLTRHVDSAALAARLLGSPDRFGRRGAGAAINYVCVHDGFTLADVISYDTKHNQANGEDNRDGEGHNRSNNHGAEGPSNDPAVLAARARQQRNLLASLLLAQGVPLLLAGDEFGNSQDGNNNAYCQDNPTGWLNWPSQPNTDEHDLVAFTATLSSLRRHLTGHGWHQVRWLPSYLCDPGPTEIAEHPYDSADTAVGVFHSAEITLLAILHRGAQPTSVRLPTAEQVNSDQHDSDQQRPELAGSAGRYDLLVASDPDHDPASPAPGHTVQVAALSVALYQLRCPTAIP